MQMRESEIITDNFLPTKKEIKLSAEKFTSDLIESGTINLEESFAQALRLNEALTIITSKLKDALPKENFEAFGLKGTFKNGGDIPQFADDHKWSELKEQLKEREELLKVALKSKETIYDSEGLEVGKISTKPRKSSLTINY